jgi:predicted DNA-binding transcriptional regulator YafY
MSAADLAADVAWSAWPPAQARQRNRLNGIEDYLFIGGNRMSAAAAAERLGVSARTVFRFRAALRATEARAA